LSGKLFNVGKVIVMPDGQVKSVERLQKTAEVKEQREVERKENERRKLAAEEAKKAGKAPSNLVESSVHSLDGVNPQRAGLIQTIHGVAAPSRASGISNKQRKTQEMLNPRLIPQKPIIPEGYKLPEGEENFIDLWDLPDEEIKKRLDMAKQKAENARKALRRKQKEEKKFNKAMKVLRKQAASKGVLFDPEQAKITILGEECLKKPLEDDNSDSSSDSYSNLGSDSTLNSGSESESESESAEIETRQKTATANEIKPNSDVDKSKKRKRSPEEAETELIGIKAPVEPLKKSSKKDILRETLEPEFIEKRLKKEEQRLVKEQKRIEKLAAKVAESGAVNEKPAKKRKRAIEAGNSYGASEITEGTPMKKQKKTKVKTKELASVKAAEVSDSERKKHNKNKAIEPVAVDVVEVVQKEKKHKQKKSEANEATTSDQSITGENWNTDALVGDEARKQKFLRLLGAGKAKSDGPKQNKSSKKDSDISKVQSDLEKQYEAGMKLKHDGGSKRRGLGA